MHSHYCVACGFSNQVFLGFSLTSQTDRNFSCYDLQAYSFDWHFNSISKSFYNIQQFSNVDLMTFVEWLQEKQRRRQQQELCTAAATKCAQILNWKVIRPIRADKIMEQTNYKRLHLRARCKSFKWYRNCKWFVRERVKKTLILRQFWVCACKDSLVLNEIFECDVTISRNVRILGNRHTHTHIERAKGSEFKSKQRVIHVLFFPTASKVINKV